MLGTAIAGGIVSERFACGYATCRRRLAAARGASSIFAATGCPPTALQNASPPIYSRPSVDGASWTGERDCGVC